jgi:hypothetical protein
VWVTEGTKPVKVEHILETMFVGDFITDHLTGQHGIVLTADKHLYRESDGNVVVAGKKLKSYVDVDEDGDKTVSFILGPPPIATSAAGTAGAGDAGTGQGEWFEADRVTLGTSVEFLPGLQLHMRSLWQSSFHWMGLIGASLSWRNGGSLIELFTLSKRRIEGLLCKHMKRLRKYPQRLQGTAWRHMFI